MTHVHGILTVMLYVHCLACCKLLDFIGGLSVYVIMAVLCLLWSLNSLKTLKFATLSCYGEIGGLGNFAHRCHSPERNKVICSVTRYKKYVTTSLEAK